MARKKKYKVRIDCTSFYDVVVEASSEESAKDLAFMQFQCPDQGGEFCEFLPIEEGDEVEAWEITND